MKDLSGMVLWQHDGTKPEDWDGKEALLVNSDRGDNPRVAVPEEGNWRGGGVFARVIAYRKSSDKR